MALQFGNFLGRFLEYDTKQVLYGYRNYMRIRVQIDVRSPLKRKKKIMISASKFTYKKFKYEKLTLFCFLCGYLGHGDNFCLMRLQTGLQELELGWDLKLRALVRRTSTVNSIWLREESDSNFGKYHVEMQFGQNSSQNQTRGS